MKKYKGYKYYGKLVDIDFIINEFYESGDCLLCTNDMQGQRAIKLLETIKPLVKSCKLDLDNDRADTLFIEIKQKCINEFMVAIVKAKPDEFDINEFDILRCWWD